MTDHNDPEAVNSIISDIDVSAADLDDVFVYRRLPCALLPSQ